MLLVISLETVLFTVILHYIFAHVKTKYDSYYKTSFLIKVF